MRGKALLAGAVLLLAVVAVCPFLGSEPVRWSELLEPGSVGHRIFFELRLPRFCLLLLAGGALAMLGGTYQSLFHNALADPYVLGISGATTLGIALAEIVFRCAPYSFAGQAVGIGAALAATALLLGAGSALGHRPERLVLFGMGLNFVLSSALFLTLSYHYQHVGGGSLRWLFGQIPWVSPREAAIFAAITAPFLLVLPVLSRHLDAMSLGDAVARTLGFPPARTRLLFIFLTSGLLAIVVCFTGCIGFVGLVVPHTVRMIARPSSSRAMLVGSFFLGAAFLCASDVLSRVILPPFEFPIGVVTTLVGGPIFLVLLWRRT